MTAGLLIVAVWLPTWHERMKLREEARSSAVRQTRLYLDTTAHQLDRVLERFDFQRDELLKRLADPKLRDPGGVLQRFVSQDRDYLQTLIYQPSARRSLKLLREARGQTASDPRFESAKPGTIHAQIRRSAPKRLRRLLKTNRNHTLINYGKSVDVPVAALVSRYKVTGTNSDLWLVVSFWQSKLVEALPGVDNGRAFLVDRAGRILSSPDLASMRTRSQLKSHPIVARARKPGALDSGYFDTIESKGGTLTGGYRKTSDGSILVIERNLDSILASFSTDYGVLVMWMTLLLLFAFVSSYLVSQRASRGIRQAIRALKHIGSGRYNTNIKIVRKDEIGALHHVINGVSAKIARRQTSAKPRPPAHPPGNPHESIVRSMMPENEISAPPLAITAFHRSAQSYGGDLWGHQMVKERDTHLVYVVDASGHGTQTLLTTGACHAALTNAIADHLDDPSPAAILRDFNRFLFRIVPSQHNVTCFLAAIDTKKGVMRYGNAGHNFPLIVPTDENDDRAGPVPPSFRKISPIAPVSLQLPGPPLGIDAEAEFQEKETPIRPGDRLFLFTDGLIECSAPDGRVWGRKFLIQQLLELSSLPIKEMKDELLSRAFHFYGAKGIEDDVTVAIVEVARSWQPQVDASAKTTIESGLPMPLPPEHATVKPSTQTAGEPPLPPPPLPADTPRPVYLELFENKNDPPPARASRGPWDDSLQDDAPQDDAPQADSDPPTPEGKDDTRATDLRDEAPDDQEPRSEESQTTNSHATDSAAVDSPEAQSDDAETSASQDPQQEHSEPELQVIEVVVPSSGQKSVEDRQEDPEPDQRGAPDVDKSTEGPAAPKNDDSPQKDDSAEQRTGTEDPAGPLIYNPHMSGVEPLSESNRPSETSDVNKKLKYRLKLPK